MNRTLASLVAVLSMVALPKAAAACFVRYADLFSQADRATTIAIGRWGGGGLRVETAIRPDQRPVRFVPLRLSNTSCDPQPRRGQRLLLLVDGAGHLVAHYGSAIPLDGGAEEAAMTDALRRWHTLSLAPDAAAQRALLVELATSGEGRVSSDAAYYLAGAPALLVGTTASEREALVGALRTARDLRATALAMVVARLHAPEAVPVLAERLASASSSAEDFAAALEILTGHHEPPFVWGRLLVGSASDLAQRWREWRGTVAVPPLDPRSLARTICTAPDELSRVIAAEACERARGRPLGYGFWHFAQGVAGHFWTTLAAQCEQGPPPPDGDGAVSPPAPACEPPGDAEP